MAIAGQLMQAPMVMWMRMPILLGERLSGAESQRAVSEKAAASVEGAIAAQIALAGAAFSFWPDIWAGRVPALLSGAALQRSCDAALKPSGRRVKANLRRLSRKD